MSEMSTTVRRTATKTPKWARTVNGIVRRWQEEHYYVDCLRSLCLTDRLQRLFMIGCCRFARIEDEDTSHPGVVQFRAVLGAAERFADGDETGSALVLAKMPLFARYTRQSDLPHLIASGISGRLLSHARVRASVHSSDSIFLSLLVQFAKSRARKNWCKPTRSASRSDSTGTRKRAVADARLAARTAQGRLLAGIVGPEWHLAPEWRTDTAVQIARGIYENRDFGAMPILADVLNDAGCDNEEWLARMRDPDWPWCRGCHVLDSLVAAAGQI